MRITSYKLLLFIMTLLCGSISRTEAQSVTKIELGGNSMLQVGTNATITATVSPSDAANKALKWESSNVGVVEIVGSNNNNAFIKAYSTGSAWITATAQDGSGVTGSIRITVIRLINKIILGIPGSFLDIGVTTELPVRVEPSDATGKDDLNWATSNPDVISVTSTGQITTHKTGTAVITATAKDGSGVSGQLAIKVHRPVRKVIIDGGDITLKETERKQLTATIQPADASVQSISWRIDDKSVATVTSSGYLIAKRVGKTTVTAWSDDRDGGFPKGSVEVTVEPYENKHTPVESVAIREGNQDLKVNDVKRLTAVITPDNATNKNMTWVSSKADIASVSANGLVKAHKAGETTVTVTTVDGAKTASVQIKVTAAAVPPPPVTSVTGVSLNKSSLTLPVGGKEVLTTTVTPHNATNRNVTWSSSNEAVASVDDKGEVTAHKAGEATVTVTTVDGAKTASVQIKVTAAAVPPPPVTSVTGVSLNKSSLTLPVGGKEVLTTTVTPHNATNRNVTWSSSNEAVASVDDKGEVTAYKAGEATVTVTTVDGSKTATCKVIVQHITNANVEVGEVFAVWSENGRLHIDSPAAETVDIYSINGGLLGRIIKIPGKVVHDLHLSSQSVLIVRGSSGWTRKIKL